MFVSASAEVGHPVGECADALTKDPESWFPGLVSKVGSRSPKHLAAVGFNIAGIPIRKKVEVSLEEPVRRGDWLEVPISWKPTFPKALFPSLLGKLMIAPLDQGRAKLTVSGIYQPPFDALGKNLDEALMHRAAEATFQDLAQSIAEEIDRILAG